MAKTWAIPFPIVPAPITVIFFIVARFYLSSDSDTGENIEFLRFDKVGAPIKKATPRWDCPFPEPADYTDL